MKQIEKHPAPEKLLQQITEEAINALALGGPDKIGDEAPMEAGVKLIAKTLATSQVSAAMQIPMGYVYLILPLTGIIMMFYALWFITNGLQSLKQSEGTC